MDPLAWSSAKAKYGAQELISSLPLLFAILWGLCAFNCRLTRPHVRAYMTCLDGQGRVEKLIDVSGQGRIITDSLEILKYMSLLESCFIRGG